MKCSWGAVAGGVAILSAVVCADGGSLPDVAELLRTRGWVAGSLTSSQPTVVPSPADRVTINVGGDPRVVYQLTGNDVSLSEPVVSRDGAMLAFAKIEDHEGRKRRFLYVMLSGGVLLRRIAELDPPSITPHAAHDRLGNLAWSHDNTRLAYWGRLAQDGARDHLTPLHIIDVRTGDATLVGRYRTRTLGEGYLGPVLSDQAWALDSRLVYTNHAGELVILNVVTRTETVIGVGAAGTWSPDGDTIAARVRLQADPFGDADYVLIDTSPPYRRTLLASYRAPKRMQQTPFIGAVWYFGPALWTPDSRFLILRRVVGEHEELFAIDRANGGTKRLPSRYWETRSLGGRP